MVDEPPAKAHQAVGAFVCAFSEPKRVGRRSRLSFDLTAETHETGGLSTVAVGVGISTGRVKRWHAANRRIRHHPPANFESCSTG